jgi:ubiquitin carboxyl-terminal hydrolase L3
MDSIKTATRSYTKCWIPLESDPPVLNDLMYGLGVSSSLTITDVWSIDDPVQLSFISRPVFALILVLPTSDEYERHRQSTRVSTEIAEDSKRERAEVIWIQQSIDNACGLYAILHATCNFETREFIGVSIVLGGKSFR